MQTVAMEVTAAMLNGHGVCHGGLLFALADTALAHASNHIVTVVLDAVEALRSALWGQELLGQELVEQRLHVDVQERGRLPQPELSD